MLKTAELDNLSPKQLLGMMWVVLAILIGLFAADLQQWAVTHDGGLGRRLLPATTGLSQAAAYTGLPRLKAWTQLAPRALYSQPLLLCAVARPQRPGAPVQALLAPAGQDASVAVTGPTIFQPKRILIAGASSIQSGLGTALEAELERFEEVEILRFGQHSTGLARPDYFDWQAKLGELIKDFQPDLIIGQWGENDCQGMTDGKGTLVANFATPEWDAEYGKRVESLVQIGKQAGCRVVLLGVPHMRQSSFSNKVARLNGVTEQAAATAGAEFVSLWDITSDEKGGFRSTIEVDGRQTAMRAGDGIHFSTAGAAFVATEIRRHLEAEMLFIEPAAAL